MKSFVRITWADRCRLAAMAILSISVLMGGCVNEKSSANGNKDQKKSGAPIPVVMAPVTRKTMPVQIQAIGNVEAYSTVAVKSRLDGQIFKSHFVEGQDVREGDMLFDIDSRDLESKVRQAEANLERDKAQLEYAFAQERRYRVLMQEDLVSKEMYSQIHTNLDAATATIRVDEAAIESAKVQLEYCKIRSPIDGRTGKALIHEGNMVKANDTNPLVIINKISPIYVAFSVPEKFLDIIRKYKAAKTLKVVASIPQDDGTSVAGDLSFIDNAVDSATGTIKLKATFLNKDKRLWPGQFANVALTLYEQTDAIVVPSQALQVGPNGSYVFVVKPDLAAELRPVTVDRADATETVVAKGLAVGENVVISGQLRLLPGAKVKPKLAGESS